MKNITIGDTEYQILYPDLLRGLRPQEYDDLKASIIKHGITCPVVLDDDHGIIDGGHRAAIAADRRHLTVEELSKLRGERIERVQQSRSGGKSLRTIAADKGVSLGQVQRDLSESGVSGDTPKTVTGKDGKTYRRKRRRKPTDEAGGKYLCYYVPSDETADEPGLNISGTFLAESGAEERARSILEDGEARLAFVCAVDDGAKYWRVLRTLPDETPEAIDCRKRIDNIPVITLSVGQCADTGRTVIDMAEPAGEEPAGEEPAARNPAKKKKAPRPDREAILRSWEQQPDEHTEDWNRRLASVADADKKGVVWEFKVQKVQAERLARFTQLGMDHHAVDIIDLLRQQRETHWPKEFHHQFEQTVKGALKHIDSTHDELCAAFPESYADDDAA